MHVVITVLLIGIAIHASYAQDLPYCPMHKTEGVMNCYNEQTKGPTPIKYGKDDKGKRIAIGYKSPYSHGWECCPQKEYLKKAKKIGSIMNDMFCPDSFMSQKVKGKLKTCYGGKWYCTMWGSLRNQCPEDKKYEKKVTYRYFREWDEASKGFIHDKETVPEFPSEVLKRNILPFVDSFKKSEMSQKEILSLIAKWLQDPKHDYTYMWQHFIDARVKLSMKLKVPRWAIHEALQKYIELKKEGKEPKPPKASGEVKGKVKKLKSGGRAMVGYQNMQYWNERTEIELEKQIRQLKRRVHRIDSVRRRHKY